MATTSAPREIDWSTAAAESGSVTVELSGSSSKRWREHFEGVLRLLSHDRRDWGEVSVSKNAIVVDGLRAGAEPDLRHFLESVVVQVNSELAPPDGGSPEQRDDDPQAAADRAMTGTLRAFADDG